MDSGRNLQVDNVESFSTKNTVILVLSVLLILSFLGINLLDIISNFIKLIIKLFGPLVSQILSIFGYTTGTIINSGAAGASDVAKGAIDVAEGTIQSVGDLMIKASKSGVNYDVQRELDTALTSTNYANMADSDISENPIQKPISSNKTGWCLVGEFDNKRKCIKVTEQDKCMSGQIFPNEQVCIGAKLSKKPSFK